MKVYQCIHKYPSHIPLFERKYGVTDEMDFETLRRLLVEDGYASTYILKPALEHRTDEVFYTVWNYERLQLCWARERGLNTRNLSEIKLAQIEEYQPDVFYNFSPWRDGNFINYLGKSRRRKDLCWNGIIEPEPRTFLEYDGHVSLHRPHVRHWKERGLASCELQPGIPDDWAHLARTEKSSDVIFYGQYFEGMFSARNRLISDLMRHKLASGPDIRCYLDDSKNRQVISCASTLPHSGGQRAQPTFPDQLVMDQSLPPIYGDTLYRAISEARIAVNAYTDFNNEFKSNMRLFESIGLGAFLISERGQYPEGFEPDVDFYTFRNSEELIEQIDRVLSDWPAHAEIAQRTRQKIGALFNKQRQWDDFQGFVATL